jgi:hypothetical protein
MLIPGVLTRVEKRRDFACFGVNTREISTFVRVASVAGQGKVCRIVIATVFTRNDVLDLESRKWEVLLLEQTVFAAMAGSLTDTFTNRCIH